MREKKTISVYFVSPQLFLKISNLTIYFLKLPSEYLLVFPTKFDMKMTMIYIYIYTFTKYEHSDYSSDFCVHIYIHSLTFYRLYTVLIHEL